MRSLPKSMRAAAINRFGGPGVLKIRLLPVPVPAAGEVLIALDTAGVGGWDADIRGGWWPEGRPPFPLVLGTDGAAVPAPAASPVPPLNKPAPLPAYTFIHPNA